MDNDLTELTDAPVAVAGSALTSTVAGTGSIHAFYLGTNHHVYELYGSGTTWFSDDATSQAGAPVAVSGSALTSIIVTPGIPYVYYLGTNFHVYELWKGSDTTWFSNDITQLAGAPAAVSGSALTSFDDTGNGTTNIIHVYYLGTNEDVYELYETSAWHSDSPTALANGPAAVSGSALTSFVDHSGGGDVMHLFYLGTNHNVYELYWDGGTAWHSDSPTSLGGAPAAASGSALTSFVDTVGADAMRVFYVGTNGDLYELYWRSAWYNYNLTSLSGAPVPASGSALTSFQDILGGVRVYFIATNSHVYQLYGYTPTDLTKTSGANGMPASGSALTSLVGP